MPTNHLENADRTAPHHEGYPLVGVLPDMLLDGPRELVRLARLHPGQVCSAALGPLRFYLVTHPEHVQHVLSDRWQNFGKGGMYRTIRRLLGNSLFTSEGDEWVRHRRLMQPLFTSKHLASLVDVMVRVVADAIPRYEAAADARTPLDAVETMSRLAQNIIIEAMFSGTITRDESETLGQALAVAVETMLPRMFVSFLPAEFPLPGERALREALRTIDAIMFRLVRATRAGSVARNDLLSLLLNGSSGGDPAMDARQARDHLVTLFVAGVETTADTMTWLLYVLATQPTVEQALRAEIDQVLGGRRPDVADLARLPYCRAVLQETLRLYPAAWFFPRFSKDADRIGDTVIPGGSTVLLSPYATHRDPAFWPQPEVFDPGRFDPERAAMRPRFAYMPFGGGPRQCVGMQFALFEAQIMTAMLVQRLRFRLVPGKPVVPKGRGSLKPRHGLKLMLERV